MKNQGGKNGKFIPLSEQDIANLERIKKEIEEQIERDEYVQPPYIKDMLLYIDGYPDSCIFHLN